MSYPLIKAGCKINVRIYIYNIYIYIFVWGDFRGIEETGHLNFYDFLDLLGDYFLF